LCKQSGTKLDLNINLSHNSTELSEDNLLLCLKKSHKKLQDLLKIKDNDFDYIEFKFIRKQNVIDLNETDILESSFNPLLIIKIIINELSSFSFKRNYSTRIKKESIVQEYYYKLPTDSNVDELKKMLELSIRSYFDYLLKQYSKLTRINSSVYFYGKQDYKLCLSFKLVHNLKDSEIQVLLDSMINSILYQKRQNARVFAYLNKGLIKNIVFKYELDKGDTELNLLESSFNPLFFLRNINLNKILKTINLITLKLKIKLLIIYIYKYISKIKILKIN